MNRIKISPLATAVAIQSDVEAPATASTGARAKLGKASDTEISVFVPMHYEKNYAYPLIVWLHGNGQSSRQLQQIMPRTSMRNYVGVAPQGPQGNFEAGYYWDEEIESIDSSHEAVAEAIDRAMMRFNIAPQRIFLAGEGDGGTMAFRVAFERPDLFAGVISLNGPMPSEQKPLVRWIQCRELPVFWAHCRRSDQFDQSQLCEQLRLLHIAGFSVNLRQYPNASVMENKAFSDMDQWVMEMISSSVRNPK